MASRERTAEKTDKLHRDMLKQRVAKQIHEEDHSAKVRHRTDKALRRDREQGLGRFKTYMDARTEIERQRPRGYWPLSHDRRAALKEAHRQIDATRRPALIRGAVAHPAALGPFALETTLRFPPAMLYCHRAVSRGLPGETKDAQVDLFLHGLLRRPHAHNARDQQPSLAKLRARKERTERDFSDRQ